MFKEFFEAVRSVKKEAETTALAVTAVVSAGCTNPAVVQPPHPEASPSATPNPYQENLDRAAREIEAKNVPWISENDGIMFRVRSATADVAPEQIDVLAQLERSDADDSPAFASDSSTGSIGFLLVNRGMQSIAALSKIVQKPAGSSVDWKVTYRAKVASGSQEFHPEVYFINDPLVYAKLLGMEASGSVKKIDTRIVGREEAVGTIYRYNGKFTDEQSVQNLIDELNGQQGTKRFFWENGEFVHPSAEPVELEDPQLQP